MTNPLPTADAMHALLDDDDTAMLIRALLINPDESNADLRDAYSPMLDDYAFAAIDDLRDTILTLRDAGSDDSDTEYFDARELLTETALSLSLCPLHLIDYAICFDDNDADCRSIRMIHPIHDT